MQKAVRGGLVLIGVALFVIFAPIWTRTVRVVAYDIFPLPEKLPPEAKIGTYKETERVSFWESDYFRSLRKSD